MYHPAILSGRVVEVRRGTVVLQPLTGRQVVITRYIPYPIRYRVNQYATIPAMYLNGNSYAYACAPQYYPQVAQYYSNYYGTPVAYVNGCYVPQNVSTSYSPYYAGDGDADDVQYNGVYTPYGGGYATPYDNCMWSDSDNDGDGNCIAPQTYGNAPYGGYNNYPYGNGPYGNYPYGNYPYGSTPYPYGPGSYPYSAAAGYGLYAPQQIQGVVVAKTGTTLMVLSANGFKPIFVNESPALQNGFAVNGPVAVGQVIDAYGFYNGDMFVATALM
jgi:hypothetical protein